jgi:hypothetical protein
LLARDEDFVRAAVEAMDKQVVAASNPAGVANRLMFLFHPAQRYFRFLQLGELKAHSAGCWR